MNADAHAFATALDRTVNRELRYRQALARAVWVEAQASFEQAQAANDARIDDAMTNDALLTRVAPGAVIRRALRNEPRLHHTCGIHRVWREVAGALPWQELPA